MNDQEIQLDTAEGEIAVAVDTRKLRERRGDKRLKDKWWRLSNLYKIRDKNKRVVKFIPNRAQTLFHKNKALRNIILKSRQLGFTTYEAIDALDDVLFEANTEALMLSYDQASQLDIFDNKVVFSWENLNPELQELYSLDADRANKLKFNWGNKTSSSITVRSKGRGGTFNRVHVSEFAKIVKDSRVDADDVIRGTIQAVPFGGRVDIESTAEEDSGPFYEMFVEAWNRGGHAPSAGAIHGPDPETPADYKAFFFNWTYDDAEIEKVPIIEILPREFREYQDKHALTHREISYYYIKWTGLNRDWLAMRREYPTTVEEAFVSSGNKFFDEKSLEKMQTEEAEVVDNWRYFEDYKPGHRYALAADPSEGVGRDNATVVVIDFDAKPRPKVVAVYANAHIPPDLFAYIVRDGGVRFGNCIAAPERNNHGHTTIATLKGMYYNIYKEHTLDRDDDTETERLGWHTNMATKPRMLYELATAIAEGLIEVPDALTLKELKAFPREEIGRASRDPDVRHYDRVIALAIAWQMRAHATAVQEFTEERYGNFDPFKSVGEF